MLIPRERPKFELSSALQKAPIFARLVDVWIVRRAFFGALRPAFSQMSMPHLIMAGRRICNMAAAPRAPRLATN
jgi:hypothetical protein